MSQVEYGPSDGKEYGGSAFEKKKKGKPVFLTFIKEPTMGDVPILHFVFGYGINTW